MAFGPVKKNAIAEEIIARLLGLIRDRQLQPGDKLPPERELAAMLGVSRPSLREALRALSVMNVLEMRQGDGTYVSSLEPDLLVEHLGFVLSIDDSTFLQLFETRKIVEVGIVALAAQRITDEEIAALEACVAESQACIHDPEKFLQTDLDLHERITRAARNPFLTRFMASLSQLSSASRSRTVAIPGVREHTVEAHRRIVHALKRRDAEAARAAMLDHLNTVETSLKELVASAKLAPSPYDDSGDSMDS